MRTDAHSCAADDGGIVIRGLTFRTLFHEFVERLGRYVVVEAVDPVTDAAYAESSVPCASWHR